MSVVTNWNKIFSHSWPDKLYDATVRYLATGTLPVFPSPGLRKTFFKRMESGYSINDNNQLVLRVDSAPWNTNRNNKEVLFTTMDQNGIVFRVVKDSDRDDILVNFINDPKTISLNAHTFLDKLLREGFLGITRRYINRFLNNHPAALSFRVSETKLSKPVIKSFRPEYPFQHWQMDLIDFSKNEAISKQNRGFRYILVIIDIFTKYVYMYPVKRKGMEQDAYQNDIPSILNKIFLYGDIPDILHSDNGKEFTNSKIRDLCNEFKIRQIFGDAYSPQTQGFVENKNKQIKSMLNVYFIKYNNYKWYDILDRLAYTINNSKHFVTGYTPMQLHRGRDVNLNFRLDFTENKEPDVVPIVEYGDVFDKDLELHYASSKDLYNKRVTHVTNILKSEATKRETVQNNTIELDIGSIVKIVTHVKTMDSGIQAVIVRIGGTETRPLENPITYTEGGVIKRLSDAKSRKSSIFSKTVLKSKKLYPQLFRVHTVVKTTPQSRQYTLRKYSPTTNKNDPPSDEPVYRSVNESSRSFTYTTHFHKAHLFVLNPMDYSKHVDVVPAKRPRFLEMTSIDHIILDNDPEDTPSNIPPVNNNIDNVLFFGDTRVRVIRVPSDGDCMFESVIKGLNHIKRLPLRLSDGFSIETKAHLRTRVVEINYQKCLRNNSQLAKLSVSNNRSDAFKNCEEYRTYMGTSSHWGGATEVEAIYGILIDAGINLELYRVTASATKEGARTRARKRRIEKIPGTSWEIVAKYPTVRLLRENETHYNTLMFTTIQQASNGPVDVPVVEPACTVETVLGPSFRRHLVKEKIIYNYKMEYNNSSSSSDGYIEGFEKTIRRYIGPKAETNGEFIGQRRGNFFELTFKETVKDKLRTVRGDFELKPELYKSGRAGGWYFVNEDRVFNKCKRLT